ncbi:thiamine pyrophosphate-dependent enzyme [Limobrevibacterium gyesilva]|uniref:thiamine pyrophosphate-dependent enzyme n=1 Tax=Limobrevibacterium gyesilva TaxID=2991712 RepID=UPI002226B347
MNALDDRRAVVASLLRDPHDTPGGELLVVTGLGSTTFDAGAAGDRPLNFYLWGAMGGAAMVGLGIALAQPQRRVLVLTGDGEMLMGLGSLATIGALKPANLAIAVMDNGRFAETGQQRSHSALGTDLAAVASACGWAASCTVTDMPGVEALRPRLRREALFAVIRIAPEEVARHLPPRDGARLTNRFRDALGLPPD